MKGDEFSQVTLTITTISTLMRFIFCLLILITLSKILLKIHSHYFRDVHLIHSYTPIPEQIEESEFSHFPNPVLPIVKEIKITNSLCQKAAPQLETNYTAHFLEGKIFCASANNPITHTI